jgi:hypothetical protein
MVNAVIPSTVILLPPAPFTSSYFPSAIFSPWLSAHLAETKVRAAPVSSMTWPLVGAGFASSHLEGAPVGMTATSMWGWAIGAGGATFRAANSFPVARLTYLITAEPGVTGAWAG